MSQTMFLISCALLALSSLLLGGAQGRSSGPPSCGHVFPEGHGGSAESSMSLIDPKGLPVTFSAKDLGNGLYGVEIQGDYIKGFLVRDTKASGSWIGESLPFVDLREGCATHNGGFASRKDKDTNLAFMYQANEIDNAPEFEAIAVKDFGTWWHRILFAPGSKMTFGV